MVSFLGPWRFASWPHLPHPAQAAADGPAGGARSDALHARPQGNHCIRDLASRCRGVGRPGRPRDQRPGAIKLFDLEPQAKIRAREKELRSIEARAEYSRRNLDLVEKSLHTGALPGTSYNDVRSTALYYESQKLAAEAELSLAQAELKLYTLTASIDGEIAWLDVSSGTVTWPGTLIWGEIVDLRELDVRCELSPAQAEQVAVGQVGRSSAGRHGGGGRDGQGRLCRKGGRPQQRLRPGHGSRWQLSRAAAPEVAVKVRLLTENAK